MLEKKKKLSKKELQEDKLVTSYYKFNQLYEKHQSKILIGLGAIAVIVVAVLFWTNKMEQENQEAAEQLAKVLPIYQQGNYQQAIDGKEGTDVKGLKNIADEYGSTENGESAKIFLANAYYYLGNFEQALEYYEDYSGEIDIFKATAYAGIAGVHAAKDNPKEAAQYFKKAANVTDNNPMNPDYLLKAGINYINSDNNKAAKELLTKIKSEYDRSQAFQEADKYLALL